ncbi:hypothetical protein WN982_01010 [Paraburkholderia sp. IMGN_8]|uniref:hypothetical protein n=1 Tax=Paraburkholderia sp. IMGN_8 TaxID=3136564 RepID=UPI0031016C68
MSEEVSITRPQTEAGWRRNMLWGVKILVALTFLAARLAKLAGVQAMIDIFNVIGLGLILPTSINV